MNKTLQNLIDKRIDETIRKVGNKWVLYTKNGKRRLGTHDTKKEAKAQETAINIAKHKKKG